MDLDGHGGLGAGSLDWDGLVRGSVDHWLAVACVSFLFAGGADLLSALGVPALGDSCFCGLVKL